MTTLGQHKSTHRICPDPNIPRLIIPHQPSPPTPLNPRQSRIELPLQSLQTAIRLVNGLLQRSRRRLASALVLRRQVLPEKGVIEVAAAVEVDEGLEGDLGGDVGFGLRGRELLRRVVEGIDVGVVVVLVVQLHDLAGDGRLQRAVVVCEGLV